MVALKYLHCMSSKLLMSANLKELITDIFQQHEEEIGSSQWSSR